MNVPPVHRETGPLHLSLCLLSRMVQVIYENERIKYNTIKPFLTLQTPHEPEGCFVKEAQKNRAYCETLVLNILI